MRFDVASELAREQERHADRTARNAVAALVDLESEASLLVAMLTDQRFDAHASTCVFAADIGAEPCGFALDVRALERCSQVPWPDGVELDDFTDLRYRAAFRALRNLQWREKLPPAHEITCAVAEEIAREDKLLDKHVADTVDLVFLTGLVFDHAADFRSGGQRSGVTCVGLNYLARRLRDLANHRRLA
jgi:hypothetical protein